MRRSSRSLGLAEVAQQVSSALVKLIAGQDQAQKTFRFGLHSQLSCGHVLLPTEEASLKN